MQRMQDGCTEFRHVLRIELRMSKLMVGSGKLRDTARKCKAKHD